MIRSPYAFLPIFLLFLVMLTGLTWSRLDQQYMMDIGVTQDFDLAFLSSKIAVGALFVAMLPFIRPYEDNPWRLFGPVPCLLFAIAAASTAWSYNKPVTIFTLVQLAMVFGYPMIAVRLLGFQLALRAIWGYTIAVIVISVILAAIGDPHALMSGMHQGLWRGLFSHKNSFGPFIVVNIATTLYGRSVIGLPRAVQIATLALDAVALGFSHASTAMVAGVAVVAVGLMFLQVSNPVVRRIWRGLSVATMAAMGILLIFNLSIVTDLLGRDMTLSHRTEMWAAAFNLSLSHPIGSGYGTGGGTQASVDIQKVVGTERSQTVQSGYINMALDLGWLPVAILVGWLAFLLVTTVLDIYANETAILLSALIIFHLLFSISEVAGGFNPRLTLFLVLFSLAELRRRNFAPIRSRRDTGIQGLWPARATVAADR